MQDAIQSHLKMLGQIARKAIDVELRWLREQASVVRVGRSNNVLLIADGELTWSVAYSRDNAAV